MRCHGNLVFAIIALCSVFFVSCTATTPDRKVNYGTSGVGPVTTDQRRALLNCFLAGDSAVKIMELRAEGKSDEEIIQYYSDKNPGDWLRLIHDLLPMVTRDSSQLGNRIDHGRGLYSRCLSELFAPGTAQVATYCYQQSQFLLIAFGYRASGKPMEDVYTKMGATGKSKVITDGLLLRAREVENSQETRFRLETYYGCLGHPDEAPVER